MRDFSPLESEIQKAILEYLHLRGHFVWRNNTGGFGGEGRTGKKWFVRAGLKGSGDIIGLNKKGQFVSIEVKRKGGKPSDDQIRFMEKVNGLGGVAFIAMDVQDVIDRGF